MKTYSESRIELRNPHILKCWKNQGSLFDQSNPVSEKSLDVAFNTAGVERIRLDKRHFLLAWKNSIPVLN